MSPILTEIVNEKGAKILLDRQAILFGDPKLDISAEVVKRLNKRLPDIKVTISAVSYTHLTLPTNREV